MWIRDRYSRLSEEKDRLYAEYGSLKKRMREYDAVKQNIDSILSPNRGQEQDLSLIHISMCIRDRGMTLPCGCPGSQSRNIQRQEAPAVETPQAQQTSRLSQWPVQIKLVPVNAPYFDGARLLIAADCTAYAYAAFHERFIKGHITLVGCPKLDSLDYSEKLTEIIRENDIKSVTVVRMEVPCCGGLEMAAKKALQQSGKFIPWQVVTVTVDGRLVEE